MSKISRAIWIHFRQKDYDIEEERSFMEELFSEYELILKYPM